jgi:hypothetical protein
MLSDLEDIFNNNEAVNMEEREQRYFKKVDVVKFNYRDSKSRPSGLIVEFLGDDRRVASICYINKKGKKKPINNIIGIVYGTRSSTYSNVDVCIPWLSISIILYRRTYDFQFNHHYELIWFLHHFGSLHYHNISYSLPLRICRICKILARTENETYDKYFDRIIEFVRKEDFKKIYKLQKSKSHECSICLDTTTTNVMLKSCQHIFCKTCIDQHIAHSLKMTRLIKCPLCRRPNQLSLSFS